MFSCWSNNIIKLRQPGIDDFAVRFSRSSSMPYQVDCLLDTDLAILTVDATIDVPVLSAGASLCWHRRWLQYCLFALTISALFASWYVTDVGIPQADNARTLIDVVPNVDRDNYSSIEELVVVAGPAGTQCETGLLGLLFSWCSL